MSQSRIPRNYTDLIPLELIKMIFENIGNDLIAHVTFSKLRPDIYEYCYKGRGKTFWQPMLRQCGISTKHLVGYDEVADDCAGEWEELAFKCVEHADACKHSKCGIARLKENERFMKKSVERGASLLEAVVPSSGFHDALMDIVPTTICSSITFQPNNPGKKLDDWTTSAFVRADGPGGDRRLRYGDELIQHPVLWRSFLTFPPVTDLRVYGGMTIEATNSNGVIVAGLIDLILETDFNAVNAPRLELQNIRELTMNVKRSAGQTPHSAQIFPSGWSFEETLRELYTFRSWFTALRWTVRMSRDRGRVSLFWVFEPQTLPEDHSEYHSLIRPWSRVE